MITIISVLLSLPKKPGPPEGTSVAHGTQHVHAQSVSRVRLCDPMDCSPQAPLSMGFSRQEHWSGLLFPSPGIGPTSPVSPTLAGGVFTAVPPGKPKGLPLQEEKV